jgi:hypothetical protein
MTLPEFEQALRDLIGQPTALRPFVCDGSPLTCSVFIVGYNPATEMTADWWTFWDPQYGYRRAEWFQEYQRERANRPLKPGKTRRLPVSNTRRVIDCILEAAQPVQCLETNIFSAPSETAASLAEQQRATGPFDFLLRAIRPRVVLAHGDDAIAHLGRLSRNSLGWGQEALTSISGNELWVVAESHFGRPRGGQGWSRERASRVGQRLKELASPQVAA